MSVLIVKTRALLLAALMVCCSKEVVGPSTEEGNPQLVAVVLDAAAHPAKGVTVNAFRVILTDDSLSSPSGAMAVATSSTDNAGRCTFSKLPAGIYTIEASDPQSGKKALKTGLDIASVNAPIRDTLHLAAPGTIKGIVSRGGILGQSGLVNNVLRDGGIMVILQEIEAAPRNTPQDGRYQFSALSPGTYTLLYYATDGFYSARRTVVVTPGDTSAVDSVILKPLRIYPPRGFSVSEETSSEDVSIVKLSWNRVAFDSLRWYEVERIDITGSFDKTFTTVDTIFADTLVSVTPGTTLNYVVRSVDKAFNRSLNAGPLEVLVK